MTNFLRDVLAGLSAPQKHLSSRYFYDAGGDAIFREIMNSPEYYLTRCEEEIFAGKSAEMVSYIQKQRQPFNLVELGPGDASKTIYLLQALLRANVRFTYVPVDISEHVINYLYKSLPILAPGIKIEGIAGDYFEVLKDLKPREEQCLALFLGSNIGNIPISENAAFFRTIRSSLSQGDLLLTGFDLVKDPEIILAAYNDKAGVTKRFNLNLLKRINDSFHANFQLSAFNHTPVYDPETGACKSYLVSAKEQVVTIANLHTIHFEKGERIYMEISQKYTIPQTHSIAAAAGFKPLIHWCDQKQWFLDALWQVQ